MRAALTLLSLAASALAIAVSEPSASQGWALGSQNTVSWTSVSTDRANFTILLVNQNTTPALQQVLKALQVTSEGSTTISLPGTVTAGSGYRVNLVQDSQDLSSILAQSTEFTIAASSSSTSTVPLSTSTGGAVVVAPTTPSTDGTASTASLPGVASPSAPANKTSGASKTYVDGLVLLSLTSLGALFA